MAEYRVIDVTGEVTTARSRSADEYEVWVDRVNPESYRPGVRNSRPPR